MNRMCSAAAGAEERDETVAKPKTRNTPGSSTLVPLDFESNLYVVTPTLSMCVD